MPAGKFGGGGYKVSADSHGVGASVVNALSDWLIVDVWRDGKIHEQRYEKGQGRHSSDDNRGMRPGEDRTKVTFLPDETIFEETIFDYGVLRQRLREMAFLTKNLKITLKDGQGREKRRVLFTMREESGSFVSYLNRSVQPLYDQIIYCEGTKDDVYVEVAMQHNDSYTEST